MAVIAEIKVTDFTKYNSQIEELRAKFNQAQTGIGINREKILGDPIELPDGKITYRRPTPERANALTDEIETLKGEKREAISGLSSTLGVIITHAAKEQFEIIKRAGPKKTKDGNYYFSTPDGGKEAAKEFESTPGSVQSKGEPKKCLNILKFKRCLNELDEGRREGKTCNKLNSIDAQACERCNKSIADPASYKEIEQECGNTNEPGALGCAVCKSVLPPPYYVEGGDVHPQTGRPITKELWVDDPEFLPEFLRTVIKRPPKEIKKQRWTSPVVSALHQVASQDIEAGKLKGAEADSARREKMFNILPDINRIKDMIQIMRDNLEFHGGKWGHLAKSAKSETRKYEASLRSIIERYDNNIKELSEMRADIDEAYLGKVRGDIEPDSKTALDRLKRKWSNIKAIMAKFKIEKEFITDPSSGRVLGHELKGTWEWREDTPFAMVQSFIANMQMSAFGLSSGRIEQQIEKQHGVPMHRRGEPKGRIEKKFDVGRHKKYRPPRERTKEDVGGAPPKPRDPDEVWDHDAPDGGAWVRRPAFIEPKKPEVEQLPEAPEEHEGDEPQTTKESYVEVCPICEDYPCRCCPDCKKPICECDDIKADRIRLISEFVDEN